MWPRPAAAPDSVSWCLELPASGEWTQIVRGALAQILRPVNFDTEGTGLDIEDVLQYAQGIFDSMSTCFRLPVGAIFNSIVNISNAGCLLCDGGTYLADDYPELAAALSGITWSDATSFAVPDMRSRMPVGAGQGNGLSNRPIAGTGGQESVALSVPELPGHDHSVHAHLTALAVAPGELLVNTPNVLSGSTGSTGSGNAHENMPPFLALHFYIVTGLPA